jgi:hypothetical protein
MIYYLIIHVLCGFISCCLWVRYFGEITLSACLMMFACGPMGTVVSIIESFDDVVIYRRKK